MAHATEPAEMNNAASTSNVRLPKAVCAAVADTLSGSHASLNAMFEAAGASGPPPDLPHHSKWKEWLFRSGNDPNVDSLNLLGNLIEEFMDLPPMPTSDQKLVDVFGFDNDSTSGWEQRRDRLIQVLEEHGFRYFRGGQILPVGTAIHDPAERAGSLALPSEGKKPATLEELLQVLISGLPRAMHPLTHRRKGSQTLSFKNEYDIQDLLHSQLRPWVMDIRPEEFTPSYAGSNTRMDFLLPQHNLVLETKRVRDRSHARRVGDELIIDIEHYRKHPQCDRLWCVVYDPEHLIPNPAALTDLNGNRSTPDGNVSVHVFVV